MTFTVKPLPATDKKSAKVIEMKNSPIVKSSSLHSGPARVILLNKTTRKSLTN
jgi:hypothetical protein